jgi:hypothetical protein
MSWALLRSYLSLIRRASRDMVLSARREDVFPAYRAAVTARRQRRVLANRASLDKLGMDALHDIANDANALCCQECRHERKPSPNQQEPFVDRMVLIRARRRKPKSTSRGLAGLSHYFIDSARIAEGLKIAGADPYDFDDHGESRTRRVLAMTGRTSRRSL